MTKRELRIAELIRQAINDSELSRYQIAKRSEISQATLSRFMAEKTSLSIESIEKLAPVLGIVFTATRRRRKT